MTIEKILEILQSQAEATLNLIDMLLPGLKESSYRKTRHFIAQGPQRYIKSDWAYQYRKKKQIYNLLNRLKNQGLIKKEKRKPCSIWKISKLGIEKLNLIREKRQFSFRSAEYKKPARKSKDLKVVIFDVPEKQRVKRDWLREVLRNLGFSMLQQSVWIGKLKLPQGFIYDLDEKNMLDYVHIFKVSRKGTIEKTI